MIAICSATENTDRRVCPICGTFYACNCPDGWQVAQTAPLVLAASAQLKVEPAPWPIDIRYPKIPPGRPNRGHRLHIQPARNRLPSTLPCRQKES